MGLSTEQAQSQNILQMKHVPEDGKKLFGLGAVFWGEDCDPSLCPCRDSLMRMFWEGRTSRKHPCISQGGAEQWEDAVQGAAEQEHTMSSQGVCVSSSRTLICTTFLCLHLENSGITLKNVLSCSQEYQYELVSLAAYCWTHERKQVSFQ